MSLATQHASLATQAAEDRRDIFGETIIINGLPVVGAWSAISAQKRLEMGGYDPQTSATVRIASTVSVAIETVVTRSALGVHTGYIVTEVITQPNNPEKVLRLRDK